MIIVCATDGLAVEQHPIDAIEIWAVGVNQHFLSGLGIGAVKVDNDFDVVEHTENVVHGIVTYRLDGQLSEADATHGTHHINNGHGLAAESTARTVGLLIHDERHILGALVFAQ